MNKYVDPAWRIDVSAGAPILVYENCSVIESENAYYVLRLISEDAVRNAKLPFDPRHPSDPNWGLAESDDFEAMLSAYKTWPEDVRKKLSVHDLRRMGGWRPMRHAVDGPGAGDTDREFFTIPSGLHPHAANLVARFAMALSEKLFTAQEKYGFSTDWESPAWMDQCREQLVEHVAKGDPRDVAAYCAFLWHHGEHTAIDAAIANERGEG